MLLYVKSWDDEIDMTELTNAVKSIEMEGLNCGATNVSKLFVIDVPNYFFVTFD